MVDGRVARPHHVLMPRESKPVDAFPAEDVRKLLVACHRRCCVCHVFCGVKMEIDHIIPSSEGGASTAENALAVCFDCHAEIHHYNVKHPRGRRFTPEELRGHRDQWLAICRDKTAALTKGREIRVGPLQAMIDELDYNAAVADRYKQPEVPVGASLVSKQFHRAIAAGAIGVLDDDAKDKIYAAYSAADEANQQLARDQAALSRDQGSHSLTKQRTLPSWRRRPRSCARRETCCFGSPESHLPVGLDVTVASCDDKDAGRGAARVELGAYDVTRSRRLCGRARGGTVLDPS